VLVQEDDEMPTRLRAHPTDSACTARSFITPQDIGDMIDHLAADIAGGDDADILGPWAVATLAAKLDLTVAISSSTDPVEIVRDLGDAWVAEFARGLDDVSPAEVPEVLRAAQAAIEKVLEEVRARGLAG
jgi:hypothetical protein